VKALISKLLVNSALIKALDAVLMRLSCHKPALVSIICIVNYGVEKAWVFILILVAIA
jgi:hypothetical protein